MSPVADQPTFSPVTSKGRALAAPSPAPLPSTAQHPCDLDGLCYDDVIARWPLSDSHLPLPPNVRYPDQHWDWAAIQARPVIDPTAWVAPGAVVYGRVRLRAQSSIWYGCVLRGDQEWIEVGEETNVQDGSILHVEHGGYPCILGSRVTLGHRAIVHGSIVGDGALIGIGATVLSRCVVGAGALIAAGAVVMEGTIVPANTLWAGCPAKQLRELSPAQRERLAETYRHYVNNGAAHRAAFGNGEDHGQPSTVR
jgi:carbonic anhydrase/acetyltransferase-like protein (isoleucine patch superfamily)